MDDTTQTRWFHPTPGRFVLLLLAVECLLWLSERFGWLGWHKGYAVLAAVAGVGLAMLLMLVWFAAALVFRWRFQFSIRSLLVLVVIVAVPCSWLAMEMKQAKREQEAAMAIEKLGGRVYRVPEWFAPPWLQEGALAEVLTPVKGVDLLRNRPTDAMLDNLQELGGLQHLRLKGQNITDAGLERLEGLKQLLTVELFGTQTTDEGVKKLQHALPNCMVSTCHVHSSVIITDPDGIVGE